MCLGRDHDIAMSAVRVEESATPTRASITGPNVPALPSAISQWQEWGKLKKKLRKKILRGELVASVTCSQLVSHSAILPFTQSFMYPFALLSQLPMFLLVQSLSQSLMPPWVTGCLTQCLTAPRHSKAFLATFATWISQGIQVGRALTEGI